MTNITQLAYLVKKGRDDLQHLVLLDSIESGLDVHLDKVQLWAGVSLQPRFMLT